jgi:hypothetical protein
MPQMTGLELQQQLGSTGSGIVASAASTITNVNDFSIGGAARAAETLGLCHVELQRDRAAGPRRPQEIEFL